MSTFGTNYSTAELRCAQAVQDAISYYLVDKTMPNYGTLYGDREKRLAIAIVENTSIGSGGGGSISDGNKGDVTVSDGGNHWEVNNLPQSRITNLVTDLSAKQDALSSGTNIKTINGQSIVGGGNAVLTGGSDQQIQFNNNGVLGASSSFLWNGTSIGLGVAAPTARLDIANAGDYVGLRLKAFSSQTVNLSEWYDSTNTLRGSVSSSGVMTIKAKDGSIAFAVQRSSDTVNFFQVSQSGANGSISVTDGGSNVFTLNATGISLNGDSNVFTLNATGISLNANNFSPVNIHSLSAAGKVGTSFNISSRNTFINSFSATNVPLVIRIGTGITQTANLIETRNSGGSVLSALAKADGSYAPASITDLLATNNSLYYSSTQALPVFKDSNGRYHIQSNYRKVDTIAVNTTLTTSHDFVLANGAITLTLPTATTITGKVFEIKSITTSSVTIATTSSELIDDQTSQVLRQYEVLKVVSNGTNWSII